MIIIDVYHFPHVTCIDRGVTWTNTSVLFNILPLVLTHTYFRIYTQPTKSSKPYMTIAHIGDCLSNGMQTLKVPVAEDSNCPFK